MTDKERFEEIKTWLNRGFDLTEEDINWLIKQAELVSYFAWKNGELNEFLNKYIEPKHLGKNVIDVAMDIIVKQAERVHELEQQNKRYREALKFYAEKDNYEPKHFDPNINNYMSTVDYDEGKKARKALEGEK